MAVNILGISAYYHDSAACLLRDGEIVAAGQEERFSRKKHDPRFPVNAVRFCLEQGGISVADLRCVVFYDKPMLKFERLLETYLSFAPRGIRSYLMAMPLWMKDKLMLKRVLENELLELWPEAERSLLPEMLFGEHHESHAASAFYPSPFDRAAVLCMDGVGEWATTSAWLGEDADLSPLWEIPFPHSIGLLYSAFTYFTGFRVNSDEYKVMGLAPYGEPRYVGTIYDHLIDVKPDGTFRLNLDYFNYCVGLTMTGREFDRLFHGPPRPLEGPITRRDVDLARSIQQVTEEVVLGLARTLREETGADCLAMAGGVALNSVSNGRILRESGFDSLWIQPAAGDAGGALGVAYNVWHGVDGGHRRGPKGQDAMGGGYLGPRFGNEEIEGFLKDRDACFERLEDDLLFQRVARELASGKVIGWFTGPMEFGPRALGGRSILADARNPKMQSVLNLKVKHRESFRPFAPSVLRERVNDYFAMKEDSPYMLLVAPVKAGRRLVSSSEPPMLPGAGLMEMPPRSDIPAVTHVDYSSRIQTVHSSTNPRYHRLLEAFETETGYAVLLNTSFNVRGEPIVCSPEDAYRCFTRTEIDVLVLENCVLYKDRNPTTEPSEGSAEASSVKVPQVANRQLRSLGLILGASFGAIGLWPLVLSSTGPRGWVLVLGLALMVVGLGFPRMLERPYRAWVALGSVLGWINTRILLGLVYYSMFVPIGIVWRIMGRDPMRRGFEPEAATYRILRSKRSGSHMQRQY